MVLPMFFNAAIILGSLIAYTFAANCTLCPNGNQPQFPTNKLRFNDGETVINCTHAYELAPTGYFENCTELHLRGKTICGCKEPTNPPKCSLCEEGSIPEPTKKIGNKTCAEWEEKAKGRFYEDCPTWQQTFGIACGCSNTKSENFCHICNKSMPFIDREVKFTDNTKKICLEIEQSTNEKISLGDKNCTGEQSLYNEPCDCSYVPPPKDHSSASKLVGRYAFVLLLSLLFVGMI